MPRYSLAFAADTDLLAIWFYIAQDQPLNADRYIDKFHEKFSRIAFMPEKGICRDDLKKGLLQSIMDDYNIIYRIVENESIEIIRIRRGSKPFMEKDFNVS